MIAVVAVAKVVWVAWGLKSREGEFEANLQSRLELMAASQVQLTEADFDQLAHSNRKKIRFSRCLAAVRTYS